jgi:hypothetical protein
MKVNVQLIRKKKRKKKGLCPSNESYKHSSMETSKEGK